MDTKAYTEVYNILELLSESEREKIPKKILLEIKNKMDKSYDFEVDEDNIEEIPLLEDTEKILSVIYTDYLANEEERKIIKNKEILCLKKKETEKQNNYGNNVFLNKKELLKFDTEPQMHIAKIENKKWYYKLIDFIKKLFNR